MTTETTALTLPERASVALGSKLRAEEARIKVLHEVIAA